MQPKQVAILGVGLLGGSIGLAVRSRFNNCRVVGYGHRAETVETALKLGALHQGFSDPLSALRGSDLVILCTPVGMLAPMLAEIAPHLGGETLVTDVGSTKRHVVETAGRILPQEVDFVGSHPMAGSEKRGVKFARVDLFDGAVCITTPTQRTRPDALAAVESFWQTLGMRITRLDPAEHDRILSDVSHLPHVLASALVAMQEDRAFALRGKGFGDMTRIASGDAALWRDILLENADNLRLSLRRLGKRLTELDALLESSQSQGLLDWLASAAERRKGMLDRREERE